MQTALIVFACLNIIYNLYGLIGLANVPVDEKTKSTAYFIGILFLIINLVALLCAIFVA